MIKEELPMVGFELLDVKKPIFDVSETFPSIHGLPYKKETFPDKKRDECQGSNVQGCGLHAQLLLGRQWRGSTAPPGGPEKGLSTSEAKTCQCFAPSGRQQLPEMSLSMLLAP